MATQLFRQEVIEAGRERLTGNVVAATPPRARLYLKLVFAFAAVLIAFLLFGRYASSAQVRGVVTFDAGIARVYPSAQSEVRAIHVRTGMRVASGDPLVSIAIAQGAGGIASQLSQLAIQDSQLARQEQLAAMTGTSETQALEAQRTNHSATVKSLERQRDLVQLLGLSETADGVRIFIGSENKLFSLSGSSLIVAPFHDERRKVVGVLGVIGPTRINYARIIPMVDYTAKLVSRLLT